MHLRAQGSGIAVPEALEDDLEALLRRCDEVRGLGPNYGAVELSPYMVALMRVSSDVPGEAMPVRAQAAAGV